MLLTDFTRSPGARLTAAEAARIAEARFRADTSREVASLVGDVGGGIRVVTVGSASSWFRAAFRHEARKVSHGSWAERARLDLWLRGSWDQLSITVKVDQLEIAVGVRGAEIVGAVEFVRAIDELQPGGLMTTWGSRVWVRAFRGGPLDGLWLTPDIPVDRRPEPWPPTVQGTALGFLRGCYAEAGPISDGGPRTMVWQD